MISIHYSYVDAEIFHATTAGVQQGGVISPLIANIALDGLECVLSGKAGYIRYADDLVVTAKSREQIEALLPTIEEFLAERGLELNTEKTKIVHVKDGFNFLGFNVRSYNGKCLVHPQKEKVQAFLKAIRAWLKTVKSIPPAAVISHLNPIIRGWSNYYKKVNSKKVLVYVEHQIWHAVYHWCLSRHPKKSKHWVLRRYFKYANGRTWTFFGTVLNQPDGGVKDIFLFRPSEVPVKPHIKVAGTASPDDSSLRDYWSKRKSKLYYLPESLPDAYSV